MYKDGKLWVKGPNYQEVFDGLIEYLSIYKRIPTSAIHVVQEDQNYYLKINKINNPEYYKIYYKRNFRELPLIPGVEIAYINLNKFY